MRVVCRPDIFAMKSYLPSPCYSADGTGFCDCVMSSLCFSAVHTLQDFSFVGIPVEFSCHNRSEFSFFIFATGFLKLTVRHHVLSESEQRCWHFGHQWPEPTAVTLCDTFATIFPCFSPVLDFSRFSEYIENMSEDKEDVDEFGLLIPPPKIQQLQKAMIEQKPRKVNIVCICCAEVVLANFIACHCPSDECVLKNENPKKKGFRTQVCKKCFLNLGLLPGAIGTVLQLRKSVKDPKHDEKYNEVTNAIQVHLEKVNEMKTRPKAFHPDHMDQTYFRNEDHGNEEYTFVNTELKLKIKDAYHKAVNSEKYIQELKLEVAQLIHVQEEMKKIIREKKEALVLAKTCYLHRLKKKQEAAAAEEETDDEADEAQADGGCGGGKKEDKHKSSTGTSSSEEEEDSSSSSSSSSDDSDDDSDNDDFNIV